MKSFQLAEKQRQNCKIRFCRIVPLIFILTLKRISTPAIFLAFSFTCSWFAYKALDLFNHDKPTPHNSTGVLTTIAAVSLSVAIVSFFRAFDRRPTNTSAEPRYPASVASVGLCVLVFLVLDCGLQLSRYMDMTLDPIRFNTGVAVVESVFKQ